jgi:hypothetical protein
LARPIDDLVERLSRSRHDRFDRPVSAVAHPAAHAQSTSLLDHRPAIADPLDDPEDLQPNDRISHDWILERIFGNVRPARARKAVKVIPPNDPRAGWTRRTAMVALVATVCGCASNRYPRDVPRQTVPSSPPSAPDDEISKPDTEPLASRAARANPQISPSVARAIEYVLQQPSDHPRAAVLDFAPHSSTPRFHVIDRATVQVLQSFRVAHGHGSAAKRNDGYAEVFSNEPGSNASSLGLYQAAETYISGVYPGLAMRMDGLSATNSNARSRFIVIHEARYMDPESWKGKKKGRPGLSDGCFVFSKADRDAVISQLHGGALIYACYEKSR